MQANKRKQPLHLFLDVFQTHQGIELLQHPLKVSVFVGGAFVSRQRFAQPLLYIGRQNGL